MKGAPAAPKRAEAQHQPPVWRAGELGTDPAGQILTAGRDRGGVPCAVTPLKSPRRGHEASSLERQGPLPKGPPARITPRALVTSASS